MTVSTTRRPWSAGAAGALLLVLAVVATAHAGPFSFGSPSTLGTGFAPGALEAADLNGDGAIDLVTTNSSSASVSVLLANSTSPGSFFSAADYAAPDIPGPFRIADINQDGAVDLVVISCGCTAPLGFYFGNLSAPGTFSSFVPHDIILEPYALAVGDLNGDGLPDIVLSESAPATTIRVLLGNISAPGDFLSSVAYQAGFAPGGVQVADFNNDGVLDIAVSVIASEGDPDGVAILLANVSAPGTFLPAVRYPTGASPDTVTVGNFNADGVLDLAVGTLDGSMDATVSVLLGNSSAPGTFGAFVAYPAGFGELGIAAADVNGDSKVDLVVADFDFDRIRVLSGNGDGTFTGKTGFPAGVMPLSPVVADIDGDGRPDIAVANLNDNTVSILLNTATYAPRIRFSSAAYPAVRESGSRTITVIRGGGLGIAVTVDYATSNGTATEPEDYTETSGTLSFGPMETSKTFTVPITDETVTEDAETINLTLSNPTGGAVLVTPDTSVITIIANDPARLHFTKPAYAVNETPRVHTFTVLRTHGFGTTVTVQYATSNGTATAGEDYEQASGILTFGPTDTSQPFQVTILDDTTTEGAKTINLTLSAPSAGAVLGVYNTAVLTITAND